MKDRETILPIQRAREVLHSLKINDFPLVVKEILPSLGISYDEEHVPAANFDGCAIKENGIRGILVNARIPYPARRNFTCAHELGHCLIETHTGSKYTCTSTDLNSFGKPQNAESEANQFAVELLMPAKVFAPLVGKIPFTIKGLIEIAERFGTSLSSTALRYVELSADPLAVVFSNNSQILWSRRSQAFPFELRKGVLSENSWAIDYFKGKSLPETAQATLASAWCFGRSASPDMLVMEESRPLHRLEAVLSLLCVDKNPDDEEWGGGWDTSVEIQPA